MAGSDWKRAFKFVKCRTTTDFILTFTGPPKAYRGADTFLAAGRGEQMDVICHPHLGMNGKAKPFNRFGHDVSKKLAIRFSGKHRLSVIAGLDDMLGLAEADVAGKARHGEKYRMEEKGPIIPVFIMY